MLCFWIFKYECRTFNTAIQSCTSGGNTESGKRKFLSVHAIWTWGRGVVTWFILIFGARWRSSCSGHITPGEGSPPPVLMKRQDERVSESVWTFRRIQISLANTGNRLLFLGCKACMQFFIPTQYELKNHTFYINALINYNVFDMFQTFKFLSSIRLVHAALWYFFNASI